MDKSEFCKAMGLLGITSTRAELEALFGTFDADATGLIEYRELYRLLRQHAKPASPAAKTKAKQVEANKMLVAMGGATQETSQQKVPKQGTPETAAHARSPVLLAQWSPRRALSPQQSPRRTLSPQQSPRRTLSPQQSPRRTLSPQQQSRRTLSPQQSPRRTLSPQQSPRRTLSPQQSFSQPQLLLTAASQRLGSAPALQSASTPRYANSWGKQMTSKDLRRSARAARAAAHEIVNTVTPEDMEREKVRCAKDARMAHAAQRLLEAEEGSPRRPEQADTCAALLKAFVKASQQISVDFDVASVRPPTADCSRRQW